MQLSASCQNTLLGKFLLTLPINLNKKLTYYLRFIPGHITLASTVAMSFCLTMFMSFYLRRENARRDQWAIDNNLQPEDYTEDQKHAERNKGDNATFYRYTV